MTRAGNTTNSDHSIIYHIEIKAIRQAECNRGKGKLKGCTLVSTAEPCPICKISYCLIEIKQGYLRYIN
ncbi:MAG: deaminase [Bacteroidota bacterium]